MPRHLRQDYDSFSRLLLNAALMLERARDMLNTKEKTCSACGVAHRENFQEYLWSEQLSGMEQKLKRIASSHRKLDR